MLRRLPITLVALVAIVLGLAACSASSDTAADVPAGAVPAVPAVDVVEISGLIDPVVVDFVERRLDDAVADGSQAVILQLNSRGAVVDEATLVGLAERIAAAEVPVGIWVGPSGARAYEAAGQLLGVADVTGLAPGSRIGNIGEPLVVDGTPLDWGDATATLITSSVGAEEARRSGVLRRGAEVNDRQTATLGEFFDVLDGVEVDGRTLDTTEVVQQDGAAASRQPIAQARFFKLELLPRLMHTVASPPVAYLLLIIGLALLVFEFFTAGVGVAGGVGVVSLVLAAYGVVALPTRWWALALIVVAVLAYAVDVQTGVPRFWTAAATVAFVIGSLFLFEDLPLSWLTLLVGIGGIVLAFVAGMPSMVRARFATPTIGREWMIGELGEAIGPIDPDGVVSVAGARWAARTNRATPLPAGARARVVAIDGTTLEVEPETGGARDHRERARRHDS